MTNNFLEYEDQPHRSFETVLPGVLGSLGYSPIKGRGGIQSLSLDPWTPLHHLLHGVAPDPPSGDQRGDAPAISTIPLPRSKISGEPSAILHPCENPPIDPKFVRC